MSLTDEQIDEIDLLSSLANEAPWHAIKRGDANDPYIFSHSKTCVPMHGPVILTGLWPIHENTPEATEEAERITFANTFFVVKLRNAWSQLCAQAKEDNALRSQMAQGMPEYPEEGDPVLILRADANDALECVPELMHKIADYIEELRAHVVGLAAENKILDEELAQIKADNGQFGVGA